MVRRPQTTVLACISAAIIAAAGAAPTPDLKDHLSDWLIPTPGPAQPLAQVPNRECRQIICPTDCVSPCGWDWGPVGFKGQCKLGYHSRPKRVLAELPIGSTACQGTGDKEETSNLFARFNSTPAPTPTQPYRHLHARHGGRGG